MAQETILVVEDDENILELIGFHLHTAGFDVQQTFTGEEALQRVSCAQPDLILLDLMLPKMSGLEVCSQLKGDAATRAIPVIIVSARGADADVVAGLEAGADDYVVKPFKPAALMERVRDMLDQVASRRCLAENQDLVLSELHLRPDTREIRLAGRPVTLTDDEFRVLYYLARHAGRIRTRGQIRAALACDDDEDRERIDDLVVRLCTSLGDAGVCIETIRRIGYRFKDPHS